VKLFDMLAELDENEPVETIELDEEDILTELELEEEVPEEKMGEEAAEQPLPLEEEPRQEELSSEEAAPVQALLMGQEPVSPESRIRFSIRAEWVMAVIALLCAVLLGVMVVLCMPYMFPEEAPETQVQAKPTVVLDEEDPEALQHPQESEILEPTVSETEPENPTIPPDKNPYDKFDFQYNRNNYLLLQNLKSSPGVDVSAYQGNIDWKKVKDSGIEFAIIRLGYRGYGSGKLVKDDYAVQNLNGARNAGLKVGAYFFSQALSIKEADEEITFMMDVLDGFLPDMPLILDWEIPTSDARTAGMDARTLTDIQKHYCEEVTERGYTPMIYFNWYQSEHLYYLSELEDYPFWLALYQDRMTYPWKVEMWQYTDKGYVPGIPGPVDLNVYMP